MVCFYVFQKYKNMPDFIEMIALPEGIVGWSCADVFNPTGHFF
jgi:hypothetical protein